MHTTGARFLCNMCIKLCMCVCVFVCGFADKLILECVITLFSRDCVWSCRLPSIQCARIGGTLQIFVYFISFPMRSEVCVDEAQHEGLGGHIHPHTLAHNANRGQQRSVLYTKKRKTACTARKSPATTITQRSCD